MPIWCRTKHIIAMRSLFHQDEVETKRSLQIDLDIFRFGSQIWCDFDVGQMAPIAMWFRRENHLFSSNPTQNERITSNPSRHLSICDQNRSNQPKIDHHHNFKKKRENSKDLREDKPKGFFSSSFFDIFKSSWIITHCPRSGQWVIGAGTLRRPALWAFVAYPPRSLNTQSRWPQNKNVFSFRTACPLAPAAYFENELSVWKWKKWKSFDLHNKAMQVLSPSNENDTTQTRFVLEVITFMNSKTLLLPIKQKTCDELSTRTT